MSRTAAQSLAAALAAFIAVTPLARDDTKPPSREHPSRATSAAGLSGVGMPDTGSGTLPVKPLTVVVAMRTSYDPAMHREIDALGNWLGVHHGRARMTVVARGRSTPLIEPSMIAQTPTIRSIPSLSKFTRAIFSGRPGQRLLITIGLRRTPRPAGAATLWLLPQNDAPIVDGVPLRDHRAVEQPVDARRPGAVAATAARAVISLAHLREVRP